MSRDGDEDGALARHLGGRLRRLRLQRGRSLEWLGEVLGRSQQQMSRYEHGESPLTAVQLYLLGRVLGVPVGWFFQGFADDPAELRRLGVLVGESPAGYQPAAAGEQEAALLEAWRRLPEARQRRLVIELLESFASGR